MINATGRLIAAFSFIAFAVNIPPFCYHCGNKNIPACSLILWLSYNHFTSFINALIWSGENFNVAPEAPVYCDLTVRISTGASSGKICAIACLMLNLYMIIDARNHKFLDSGSRRRLFINLAICWFTPVTIMGTSAIVQSSRYVIVRYRGCIAPYGSSFVSLVLVTIWPLVWSLVALVFATLTLWTYVKKRRDIKDLLRCTNSGLTLRRFARLLIFSLLVMFIMCPFAIYNFTSDISSYGINNFSWSETHDSRWGYIYKMDSGTKPLSTRIIDMILSAISFLLFGLGSDALDMYRRFLIRLGFAKFNKPSPDDILMSREFSESRKQSRATQKTDQSDETAETMFEYSKFKELVFPEPPLSIHLTPTLAKSGPVCIGTSLLDDDWEAHLGGDPGICSDIRFAFSVKHH